MINNFFWSHILCVLVWIDAKTLGIVEGANGVVVETGIADAIALIHDSPLHVFQVFGIMS
jgi:hypothetical protein